MLCNEKNINFDIECRCKNIKIRKIKEKFRYNVMEIYWKIWIFIRFLIPDMGMSSRFFNKKNKIRKIKIREYIQCYGFKKIKEKYKFYNKKKVWHQPASTFKI